MLVKIGRAKPNNAFHSDGPRFTRPAGERERWAI